MATFDIDAMAEAAEAVNPWDLCVIVNGRKCKIRPVRFIDLAKVQNAKGEESQKAFVDLFEPESRDLVAGEEGWDSTKVSGVLMAITAYLRERSEKNSQFLAAKLLPAGKHARNASSENSSPQ